MQVITNISRIMMAIMFAFVLSFSAASITGNVCEEAYASITVGTETIEGYQPSDIVSTDVNIDVTDASEVTSKAENTVVKITRVIIPILMIACVCIIIYNAIRNIFLKPEQRVRMGDVIKNMFIQFFFILFAWIIVELIVFAVTGSETLLLAIITS